MKKKQANVLLVLLAIDVALEATGGRLSLTLEDIQRYGPALFSDHRDEDGSRVLVWTE
jgi:hypothetical protein